jgi:hypothetical protein
MRLLQLNPNGNEATALDLHPMVTVVMGLSPSGRERVRRAAAALPVAGDPGTAGLIEAHGILLDLTPEMLRLLGLDQDRDVIVTAADVAAVAGGSPPGGPEPLSVDAFLQATPAGLYRDLDELRNREAQANEALDLLREARDKARAALEDARVQRRRAELAVESASATAQRAHLRLVTEAAAGGDTDRDGGRPTRDADADALEQRRREVEAAVQRIDRGIEELAGVDVRPIQVLLEAIHNPVAAEYAPSERANELADEFVALQRELAALEESLDARGLGSASAMARLDTARAELEAAEVAVRPPEFTDQDRADLEAAHDEVLESERKARGRGGKKRLEEAIEREQSILDRMGFPTWSAYVMGSSVMGIEPAAEQRLERARFEYESAEQHWSNVAAMIEADPVHRELLDRVEAVYVEAFQLLGGDDNQEDLEHRLRNLQEPTRQVSVEELVDALAYQLEATGMGLAPGTATLDRVVLVAEAFLEEASAIRDRIQELTDERVEALTELRDIDDRLQRLVAVPASATGWAGDEGTGELPESAASGGPDDRNGEDLAELERQLEAARADEHDYAEMVEARDSLVDAAIQVESVAAGRLQKRAAELAAASAGQGSASGRAGGPTGAGASGSVVAVETYLLERADRLRRVSYAGSVPLVLDDVFAALSDTDERTILDRLDRRADEVQIIYLAGPGDTVAAAWAERVGFERAAVVAAPPDFA